MKKGFTLIEVIGVIILLSAIVLITIPIVDKQIKEGRDAAYNGQIEMIKLSAENWMTDNLGHKPANGEKVTIMLSQLKQAGLVKVDIKNPLTKELFANDMLIEITNEDGILNYEVLVNSGTDFSIYDGNTPFIILNGQVVTNWEYKIPYNDLGIVAKDNNGNTISDVSVENNVDINKIGTYHVIYTVTNNDRTNKLIRTVNVKDTISPVLNIPTTELTIYDNELVNVDLLNGVTAIDNSGNATIKTKSNLSILPGKYTITYIATDESGNSDIKTRNANIIKSGNPIFIINNMNVKMKVGETINLMNGVYALDAEGYSISDITCTINGASCNTASLTIGDHVIVYVAKDKKNNKTTVFRNLYVDSLEYADNSGANRPILYDKMIPVTWNGSSWVYAEVTQKWYDYDNKEWANAVVLNDGVTKTVGNTISESDIAMMYVWIPRYKYTIFNGNNESKPVQEINVVFESGTAKTGTVTCTTVTSGSGTSSEDCGTVTNGISTYTHPAFTFGSTSLTGFWVGKFEVSTKTSCTATSNVAGTDCDLTTLGIQIKPNVTSWRGARVATFYTSIKNISGTYGLSNTDSHMMKNMEWGAVAYLKQSKYGLGTTDIGINNNQNYTTGCGASAGSGRTTGCNTYNTSNGMLASTTGNIYGVYDMSGGAFEYVMGNMVTSSNVPMVGYQSLNNYESNFKGLRYDGTYNTSGYDFPASKYYDAYTYGASNTTHSRGKLGDATKETLSTYGTDNGGWTIDYAHFPYSNNPWFVRGGYYSHGANAGVFTFLNNNGYAYTYSSARAVVSGV